jgi:PPOX class probable F420-dependent enzyme
MANTALDGAEYISLRSYKRDGSPVDTPVWCAGLEGKLVIFTLQESYKVKRVARNPRVQVAACDVRGKLKGPWSDGTCTPVERGSAHERDAYAAFARKYGLKMRIGNFFSSLVGRRKRRLVLEVALSGAAA